MPEEDWIIKNKDQTEWPANFTPQPNKWGYLNNPRWTDEQEPQADHIYDGRESEEPQEWIPDDQRVPVEGDRHNDCGHWHRTEEYPYHFICSPIPGPWLCIHALQSKNEFYASTYWNYGVVVKCELDRFYRQLQDPPDYVPAEGYFAAREHHPGEYGGGGIGIDFEGREGIFLKNVSYSGGLQRVYKFSLNDMSLISDSSFMLPNTHTPRSPFFYKDGSNNKWFIFGDNGQTLYKMNWETLAVDSTCTFGLPTGGGLMDIYYPRTGKYCYACSHLSLACIDLDTMTIVAEPTGVAPFYGQPYSGNEVWPCSGGLYVGRGNISWSTYLYDLACQPLCAGAANYYTCIGHNGLIWGFYAGIGTGHFAAFNTNCCDAFGNCLQTVDIRAIDLTYFTDAMAAKEDNPNHPKGFSGLYGAMNPWIYTVIFDNYEIFYHQICLPEGLVV